MTCTLQRAHSLETQAAWVLCSLGTPSLKIRQTIFNESLHLAANSYSSWTIPFEGYLYFRLKQTCFFCGRLNAQQYHTVLQVGVHILPVFPFSWFTLPPFGLFSVKSVGHIFLGYPASPAMARHNLQLSCKGQRWGTVPSVSSPHPGCYGRTTLPLVLQHPWRHSPACTPGAWLCPLPWDVLWQHHWALPVHFEWDLLYWSC